MLPHSRKILVQFKHRERFGMACSVSKPIRSYLATLQIGCLEVVLVAFLLLLVMPFSSWAVGGKVDFNQMNEAQERMLMYPSLVSADDYRQGTIEQRKINVSALFRGENQSTAARQAQTHGRRLPQPKAGGPRWRPKIGLLFASGFAPARAAQVLHQAAPAIMAGFNYLYLGPDQLQTVLNGFRYRQALANPVAVAAFLAEYPGSRYLIFLDRVVLPARFPGFVGLDCFVVDGYANRRLPGRRVQELVAGPGQIDQALGRCLYQAVGLLRPVVAAARPQGKIFLVQGTLVYLNVGLLSGLKSGQELEILAPGRVITDPRTGQPVGQVPGPAHGRIRIVRGFGYDLAEARLLAGGARMGDLVEW
jgi:hypothetical protein